MTNTTALLIDSFGRIRDAVQHAATALSPEQLSASAADGWGKRFGLPVEVAETGYSHTSSDDIARLTGIIRDRSIGYHDEVHDRTVRFLSTHTDIDIDIDRLVDRQLIPSVAFAVRRRSTPRCGIPAWSVPVRPRTGVRPAGRGDPLPEGRYRYPRPSRWPERGGWPQTSDRGGHHRIPRPPRALRAGVTSVVRPIARTHQPWSSPQTVSL